MFATLSQAAALSPIAEEYPARLEDAVSTILSSGFNTDPFAIGRNEDGLCAMCL
jgi:hypothetical protein